MISLFIDTSISYPTIVIVKDDNIIYYYHEQVDKNMSTLILPIINEGLIKNNLSIKDVDKLFVVTGPGSFTGIRIGVAIAKTIAWALKKDVIEISSLELIASANKDKKYAISMIDARRNNVFAGVYDLNLNSVMEDCLINKDELYQKIDMEDSVMLSYDAIECSVKPEINIIKVISKHFNDLGINPHKLKPNYLKLTEAEENRLKND